jgi:hypothetical protein
MGGFADYKARFIRFCITSYAINCLKGPSRDLTETQKQQIRRCVACANHVLDWPLSRSPVFKDRLRYVDDSAAILISYCCLFIMAICQTFTSSIPNVAECLDYVTSASQLCIDLAMNADHEAHIQGTFLLKRAEAFRLALANSTTRENEDEVTDEQLESGLNSANEINRTNFEALDQLFNDDGFYGMEPIWDFSMLFSSN